MALVVRDSVGVLTLDYEAAIENLAKSLLKGSCIFFLGAGASISPEPPSLPTGADLSKRMAARCRLEWHEAIPLSQIAFYYESFFTRQNLNDFLVEEIGGSNAKPSPTVTVLNDLIELLENKTSYTNYIFTTNYDQQFERLYEERHTVRGKVAQQLEVIIYKGGQNPNRIQKLNRSTSGELQVPAEWWAPASTARTVLYKLHGCISQPEDHGLVITEEDYINFLANGLQELNQEMAILSHMRGKLALSTILFIGYSLADWNFRAVFKGTVEKRLEQKANRSYAVQHRRSIPGAVEGGDTLGWEPIVKFWHEKKVDILEVDAHLFMTDLLAAVRTQSGGHGKGAAAQ